MLGLKVWPLQQIYGENVNVTNNMQIHYLSKLKTNKQKTRSGWIWWPTPLIQHLRGRCCLRAALGRQSGTQGFGVSSLPEAGPAGSSLERTQVAGVRGWSLSSLSVQLPAQGVQAAVSVQHNLTVAWEHPEAPTEGQWTRRRLPFSRPLLSGPASCPSKSIGTLSLSSES